MEVAVGDVVPSAAMFDIFSEDGCRDTAEVEVQAEEFGPEEVKHCDV